MSVSITNGSFVHRLWSENAELLAHFQYNSDALTFAQALIAKDQEQSMAARYLVTDTYNGEMTSYTPPAKAEGK